ncbi:MAG: hypothetical protein NTZ05_16985, partial [Chloroflexi bacterium]|nr:hypothetical protein [Chloroflexota bacterium]
ASGTGLGGSQPLTVVWDNPRTNLTLIPANAAADVNGAFTGLSFIVPPTSSLGRHVATVVGGTSGRSVSAAFTVTSPAVPPVETKTPLNRGLEGAAAAILGDTLYVTHGTRFGLGDTNAINSYSLTSDTWIEGLPTPDRPPTPRSEVVGLAGPDGRMYILGGRFSAPNGSTDQSVLATVERYDPAHIGTILWSIQAPMPTARAGLGAALVGNFIYAVGGRDGLTPHEGAALTVNEAYDTVLNVWTTKAPMPVAMMDIYSTVAYQGKVYVFGGYASAKVSSLVQVYDPATNTWSIGAPMPTRRSNFVAAECGGKLYAFGGLDDAKNKLGLIEMYAPASNAWSSVTTSLSAPRANFAAAGVSNGAAVYLVGGGPNGTFSQSVERFNCALAGSVAVIAPTAPTITLTSNSGIPGASIRATGGGLMVGELATLRLDSATSGQSLAAAISNDTTYDLTFTIPPVSSGGVYTVRIIGAASGKMLGTALTIIAPSLTIQPDGGPTGTRVQISGTGLPPGERLNLTLATGGALVGMAQPNSSGAFTTSATIPSSLAAGAATINIARQIAPTTIIAVVTFTAQSVTTAPLPATAPLLTFSPSCGPVNSLVSSAGSNLGTGQTVTLFWDAPQGAIGTTPAQLITGLSGETAGAFSGAQFLTPPAPANAVGDHVATVLTSGGRSASARFRVVTGATGPWACMQEIPGGTRGSAAGWIGGKLYVSHGELNGDSSRTAAYNPSTDTWAALQSAGTTRADAAAAVSNGKFYVFGGRQIVIAATRTETVLDTAEVYDPALNTWTPQPSLPVPTDGSRTVGARAGMGAAAIGSKIYVVGGRDNALPLTGTPLGVNQEYDTSTGIWTLKAPMPIPMMDIQSTVASGGKVYVFGGYTDNATGDANARKAPSRAVQIYDPATDAWTFGAALPTPRSNFIVGECGGRLYAIGGLDANKAALGKVEGYDPSFNTWVRSADDVVTPRAGFAAGPVGTGTTVWAVGGGQTGAGLPNNERFTCGAAT